jgi:hypothetical protein
MSLNDTPHYDDEAVVKWATFYYKGTPGSRVNLPKTTTDAMIKYGYGNKTTLYTHFDPETGILTIKMLK